MTTVGVPDGIRTRVTAVKGRCPRPLDDGDAGGFAEAAGRRRDTQIEAYFEVINRLGSCQNVLLLVMSAIRSRTPLRARDFTIP